MSAKPSLTKRIFLSIWKTINGLRKLVLNIIFFGVLAIFLAVVSSDDSVKIEPNSALVLNLGGSIVDQKRQVDPLQAALAESKGNKVNAEILLADIIYVINNAASDKRISTLVLDLSRLKHTGISKLESIGIALENFKASGKEIVAIGNYYNQKQYFLASYANTVYLNPKGSVSLDGFSRYRQYYKSALDKLKVKAHVFRVGTFKSAVEPYLRNDMSAAAKQANQELLDDLWQSYAGIVAKNRDIPEDNLVLNAEEYLTQLDKAGGDSAQMAMSMKWVDELATTDQFRLSMIDKVGKDKQGDSFNKVSFYDYLTLVKPFPNPIPQDTVGIIVAKGTILNGNQPAGEIGGESTSELLRKARFDENVKAVVLRVDSPGGSAFASEQIRQEVLALKQAGKPVVVSMGSLAASGGYWISASADYIFATPTTLTGSIGIFGMITTFEDSLATLGIHTDGVSTSDWAGLSVTRALSPQVEAVIQKHIEHGYQEFIDLVATSRDMTVEQVDKIAQGRVWSGKKALSLGLVDELGELDNAVTKAAALADIEVYDTKVIERELSTEEKFIQEMFAQAAQYLPESMVKQTTLEKVLSRWTQVIEEFAAFDDPNGVYLYCDNCNY